MYVLDYKDALPLRRLDWSTIDDDGNFRGRIYALNSILAEYAGEPFDWPESGFPPITGIWRCPQVSEEDDFPNRFTHAGYQHHAPNRWLFSYGSRDDDQNQSAVFADTLAGWDRRWPARGQWRRTFVVDHPTSIVTLMDSVTWFNASHGHYEAREYYGIACEIVDHGDGCEGDNESGHASVRRLPAMFLDGHGAPLPQTAAYWMEDRATYSAGGPVATLAAKEVEHLMWFVRQGDRTGGGD